MQGQHMKPRRELKAAQRIAEEAARWMYTLDRADAPELDSFSRWLLQSPLHEKAFLDVIELDETLGRIEPQLVPDPPESYEDGGRQKRGFQGSLGALFAKYGNSVEQYISRHTHGSDHHIVEDMTHEVYLRLLHFPPDERIKNPSAYLLQVARNVLMDFAQRQSRERERVIFHDVELSRYFEFAEADSVDCAQATADRQELLRLFETLPRMERAVLILCKRDRLSYRETAEFLGISQRTVKRHLASALRTLHRILPLRLHFDGAAIRSIAGDSGRRAHHPD